MNLHHKMNPELDLKLERILSISRQKIWQAYTTPELLKQWFCPKPWYVSDCTIDLRPGGEFRSVMNGPNGESFNNVGCFLEIIPEQKLVWTDALLPGFRPSLNPFFTGYIVLEDTPEGKTKYTAYGIHKDSASKKQHEEMGFEQGWGMALDQMVALMNSH